MSITTHHLPLPTNLPLLSIPNVVPYEVMDGKVFCVHLRLSPVQWVDLVNKDGRWLGMCCSAISDARDILIEALRDGGMITGSTFRELCEGLSHHDGFEMFRSMEALQEAMGWVEKAEFEPIPNPFLVIAFVYHALRAQLPDTIDTDLFVKEPRRPIDHTVMVERMCRVITWNIGFHLSDQADEQRGRTRPDAACRKAELLVTAARLRSSIPHLLSYLDTHMPAPFDGVALVRRADGKVVGVSMPAVYISRRDVEVDLDDALNKVVDGVLQRDLYELRACHVSQEGTKLGAALPWWTEQEEKGWLEREKHGGAAWTPELGECVLVIDGYAMLAAKEWGAGVVGKDWDGGVKGVDGLVPVMFNNGEDELMIAAAHLVPEVAS